MARQQVSYLIDDIDGERGDDIATVSFAYDGVAREIDLNEENRKRFEEALRPFLDHSRRVSSGPTRSAARRPTTDREENQRIREWAHREGIKVSERGRISKKVLERYHAMH